MGDKKGIAASLSNIGIIYNDQSDYPKALDYYQRSLVIREEIGDKKGIAGSLNNLGIIYQVQGDSPKALDYYQRSLKIEEEIGDNNGIASSLGNIGGIYQDQGDSLKALDYHQRSLKICEEMGDKKGIASSLNNIGVIYQVQGDYPKALDYYQRSLKIREEIGEKKGIALSLNAIGSFYQKQGDHQQAINQCSKGLLLAQEIGNINKQRDACKCLYDAYKSTGNGNKALEYHEQMLALDDSLNAEETSKKLQQMEFQKVMLADSIAKADEARLVEEAHLEEVRQKNQTRNALAGGGVLLFILAGGLYGRVRYIRKSKAVLQVEKDRSENLLLNILPADIAAELKAKGKADARDFDMVSILFTDFKGFTAASEKLSAQELVAEINTCFEAFDGIMGKYNIEKIKTIGDAYMAAGGLPVPTDDSVKNTVTAALEMQAFILDRKTTNDAANKPAFEMRVGVHTGPVVAGIVGVKKFQYDIWGDTVNTASRMESSGCVGQVNISQVTYELLKDDTQFTFESRGKIEAKGKGEMEMYFVVFA
ncbi:MAG: adenylate cyclase [Bacteroidia bacterium]|jgi:adenylate cyclase